VQITRIKPGGWIIILLLLASIIFGIRSCGRFAAGRPAADAGGSAAGDFTGGTAAGSLTASQAASGDIIVLTTGTKQKWLQAEIDKFNGQSQGGKATLQLAESRDSMQAIMAGKYQPTIWSPSSPVWMYRLADIWPSAHAGVRIADVNDSQAYRALFKSPLVFLTTKKKAAFLRPLLSGSGPWEAIRQLSVGQRKAPWGAFHFAYADPLNASSGTLTMSLIITEFAREHGGANDLPATVAQPAFATYLRQINRAYVRDKDAVGSSALEKAYTSDPSSRDFITAYESAALATVERDPNFVMIYPSPTANADQQAWLLSAPWVTDSQKTTATAFLNFLAKSDSIDDGVQYYFRPQSGGQALAARLGPNARAQFQSSPITVDLPPYDALNEAASQWNDMMK
jgi:hypothetical protein